MGHKEVPTSALQPRPYSDLTLPCPKPSTSNLLHEEPGPKHPGLRPVLSILRAYQGQNCDPSLGKVEIAAKRFRQDEAVSYGVIPLLKWRTGTDAETRTQRLSL